MDPRDVSRRVRQPRRLVLLSCQEREPRHRRLLLVLENPGRAAHQQPGGGAGASAVTRGNRTDDTSARGRCKTGGQARDSRGAALERASAAAVRKVRLLSGRRPPRLLQQPCRGRSGVVARGLLVTLARSGGLCYVPTTSTEVEHE